MNAKLAKKLRRAARQAGPAELPERRLVAQVVSAGGGRYKQRVARNHPMTKRGVYRAMKRAEG